MYNPPAIAEEIPQSVHAPSFRWVICALLFLATTINYMDRQILGILAPTLQKDIGWNEVQYGHIVMAFQTAYGIGVLILSRLIDLWGTRIGYTLSILVWSIAACLHSAAHSVVTFGSARFLLGLGEAGNFPSAVKAVAEWFPQNQRALATGIFNSGSNAGAVLAPALVPMLTLGLGWKAAFIVVGSAGFLWVLAWLAIYPKIRFSPALPAILHLSALTVGLCYLSTLKPGPMFFNPPASPRSGGFISTGCPNSSPLSMASASPSSGRRLSSSIQCLSPAASSADFFPHSFFPPALP